MVRALLVSGELGAAGRRCGHHQGSVFNGSQYRVTDVRLQIEGLDADHHLVGRRLGVGDR
jgi:hypothetical protein